MKVLVATVGAIAIALAALAPVEASHRSPVHATYLYRSHLSPSHTPAPHGFDPRAYRISAYLGRANRLHAHHGHTQRLHVFAIRAYRLYPYHTRVHRLHVSRALSHSPRLYRAQEHLLSMHHTHRHREQRAGLSHPRVYLTPAATPAPAAPVYSGNDAIAAIRLASTRWGVAYGWLLRVAECESGLNPWAYNPDGASGLFQFMPGTYWLYAARIGETRSYWNPYASANVAGFMFSIGLAYQWGCK